MPEAHGPLFARVAADPEVFKRIAARPKAQINTLQQLQAAWWKWGEQHCSAAPRLVAMWCLCGAYVLPCGSEPHGST